MLNIHQAFNFKQGSPQGSNYNIFNKSSSVGHGWDPHLHPEQHRIVAEAGDQIGYGKERAKHG